MIAYNTISMHSVTEIKVGEKGTYSLDNGDQYWYQTVRIYQDGALTSLDLYTDEEGVLKWE